MAVQQVCRTRGVGQYIATERHVMWWHRLDPLDPDAKIGMALIHGAGSTADYFVTDSVSGLIAPTAVSAHRMPAIATDAGGVISWGNSTAMTAMDATMSFFHSQTGARTDQVILLGQSMGATTVLNWARANISKVAAIVLHIPAVDLQDIIDNNRSGLGPSVTAAYGGNPPSAFNPAVNTATFAAVPIRIWYSSNDIVCVPSVVTAFGAATGATMTNLGAVNHTITGIDIDDMSTWLAQYI